MIVFYFDPISPYAWLASTQIERLSSESGLPVIAKPVLFAGFLKAHGHKGPAEIPAKREYTFRDVLRRAASYGLTVEGPPEHPFNPLLALRTSIAITDDEHRLRYAQSIMHAAWGAGHDITQEVVVHRVLDECGIDATSVLAAASTPEVKQSLIKVTEHAIHLGMFGVPCFVYEGQVFWGDDRIDELLQCIEGQKIDENKLARILARGSAVNRKS